MKKDLIDGKCLERISQFLDTQTSSWIETLSKQIAEKMEETGAGIGQARMDFYEKSELKKGTYVPCLIIAVVSSDSLLGGNDVALDWKE